MTRESDVGRVQDPAYKILGHKTDASGVTYGVEGRVDSPDGFGLYTPDDARVEGAIDAAGTDFRVEADTGPTGTATNVVLGHRNNTVGSSVYGATIGGGGQSDAHAHEVTRSYGTVGGGWWNRVTGKSATIAGGQNNQATNGQATVAGGIKNVAGGSSATVGGGYSNAATGFGATIPGGNDNVAAGQYSFAAGNNAEAINDGAFVWADSNASGFNSTGADQFVVDAGGGVGLQTNSPATDVHLVGTGDGDAFGDPSKNAVLVENESDGSSSDVLGIKGGPTSNPGSAANLVSFYDGGGSSIGAIEGDGAGGVTYKTSGSDYAEYLPRADPAADFEPGDVVGVAAGRVVADAAAADAAMVVSRSPNVVGNDPGADERDGYEPVAFVGQVPVRVRGRVESGDLVVPSGEADGVGRAVAPAEWTPADGPVVGQAWERDDRAAVGEVTVAVGVADPSAVAGRRPASADRVAELERENERLRERNRDLEARLAAVEDRLGVDAGATDEAGEGVAD